MRITPSSLIIARLFGRFASLVIAFSLLIAGSPESRGATVIDFIPGEVKTTVDFSGLANGVSISTLAWTGSTALVTGTSARQPASAPSGQVIHATGTERAPVTGPAFTSPFAANETAYFQSSVNRISSASSGGRIALRIGSTNFIGFGTMDTSGNAFAMFANGAWHTSDEVNNANKWYDLRLVIDVNESDITLSVGHLLVRNVTDGETEFRALSKLSNINLGFTNDKNLSDITNWRIESFRNDFQIGNLVGGLGTVVIPEPRTAAMLGVVALLGFSPAIRRFFRRH